MTDVKPAIMADQRQIVPIRRGSSFPIQNVQDGSLANWYEAGRDFW